VPDVAHDQLAIEVKHRSRLPAWIREALEQATACAAADQFPIVVLHQLGDRYGRACVMMELDTFRRMFNSSIVAADLHNLSTSAPDGD